MEESSYGIVLFFKEIFIFILEYMDSCSRDFHFVV